MKVAVKVGRTAAAAADVVDGYLVGTSFSDTGQDALGLDTFE
jgi:hypothetical protein